MSPLALPLYASGESIRHNMGERAAYKQWLVREWNTYSRYLEFCVNCGLISEDAVNEALAAAEHGDAQPLHQLSMASGDALEAHLNRRVLQRGLGYLNPNEPLLGFYLTTEGGGEDDQEVFLYCTSVFQHLISEIPLLALSERLQPLLYDAMVEITQVLGVDAMTTWDIANVWRDSERLTMFAELERSVVESPNAFWDYCNADAFSGTGLFEAGAETLEDAVSLMDYLEACVAFRQRFDAFLQRVGCGPRLPLRQAANALQPLATPSERPWIEWVFAVCDVTDAARARELLAGTVPEEHFSLDLLFQVSPGSPWSARALEEIMDEASSTGEQFAIGWPLVHGHSKQLLASLEILVDAISLIASIPEWEE